MIAVMGRTRRTESAATSRVILKPGSAATTTNVSLGGASVIRWTTAEMDPTKIIWIFVRNFVFQ
jgi:hypothetical protein